MQFEPQLAFLRYVRLGDCEIVRGIFAAVRDQDWNTIPFAVSELQCGQAEDHFSLSFKADCAHDTIRFTWRGQITGTREGVVRYSFFGKAIDTFRRNRIGLCVLHPIEPCAGQPCRVEHVDDSVTDGTFPKWISPHQPFKNIRSITYEVQPGVQAEVRFDGEVFEMEDQRNWTDASYKTYGTPLELPFPVSVEAGTRIEQAVSVTLLSSTPVVHSGSTAPTEVDRRIHVAVNRKQSLPPIGYSMATVAEPPTEAAVAILREVRVDHLRVDLNLADDCWPENAGAAADLAGRIGAGLEIALFVSDANASQLQEALQQFDGIAGRIARWLVFGPSAKSTPSPLVESASRALQQFDSSIPQVFGTNAYFAELNRSRPQIPEQGQVCYSINPQVHAFDELSLSETLGAQRWTVDTAREIFDCPVVISPITLRPRFNPNATSRAGTLPNLTEPETDPRQPFGFAAAWTAGALGQLASHPDVASLTFHETYGPRGIMDRDGGPYAMLEVFQAVRGAKLVYETSSSNPLEIAALAVTYADGRRGLVVANLCKENRNVKLSWGHSQELQVNVAAESVRVVTDRELP
jgi:hypothetical protein